MKTLAFTGETTRGLSCLLTKGNTCENVHCSCEPRIQGKFSLKKQNPGEGWTGWRVEYWVFCLKDTLWTYPASVCSWDGEKQSQSHCEGTNPARVTQAGLADSFSRKCSVLLKLSNFSLNSPASHYYPVLADALLQAQRPKKNPKNPIGREEKMAFGRCRYSLCYFVGALFPKSLYLPTQAGNHRRWEFSVWRGNKSNKVNATERERFLCWIHSALHHSMGAELELHDWILKIAR